jgi:NAD(P)-dependent dehydrogenase (short-subunit alcohol dehydrogenase family)
LNKLHKFKILNDFFDLGSNAYSVQRKGNEPFRKQLEQILSLTIKPPIMETQKIWFITGASKGFGFEITKAALEAGDKVVATVRANSSDLYASLANHPDLFAVKMDVTTESDVKDAVERGIDHFGKLDIVVNNAGYGILGAIEEVSDAEARKQYDTNVFGVLNVVRATLPFLRKQKSGHIINVSSLFAFDPLIGWALYGSTKNAVEGISQGLAKELRPFGIGVTVIEPGLFRTGFTGRTHLLLHKTQSVIMKIQGWVR